MALSIASCRTNAAPHLLSRSAGRSARVCTPGQGIGAERISSDRRRAPATGRIRRCRIFRAGVARRVGAEVGRRIRQSRSWRSLAGSGRRVSSRCPASFAIGRAGTDRLDTSSRCRSERVEDPGHEDRGDEGRRRKARSRETECFTSPRTYAVDMGERRQSLAVRLVWVPADGPARSNHSRKAARNHDRCGCFPSPRSLRLSELGRQ